MINYRNRFHGYSSLRFLHRNGKIVRSKYFTLKYLTNPIQKHSRISVIVSKKITKKAVVRNRIRRRIYEIIRLNISQFEGIFDLVIIVNSVEINKLSYADLTRTINGALNKAGIIKDKV